MTLDRRKMLGALGSMSFVTIYGAFDPPKSDAAEPEVNLAAGCGTPVPGGGYQTDATCATPIPEGWSEDADCGKKNPEGDVMSDEDCGRVRLPSGNTMEDSDCGLPKEAAPADQFKDNACGLKSGAHSVYHDETCPIPLPGGTFSKDTGCDRSGAKDKDCGLPEQGGGTHSDTDCGTSTSCGLGDQVGTTNSDMDCGTPAYGGGGTRSDEACAVLGGPGLGHFSDKACAVGRNDIDCATPLHYGVNEDNDCAPGGSDSDCGLIVPPLPTGETYSDDDQ